MKKKNLSMIERAARVALGGALTIWCLFSIFSGESLIWLLVHIALIALGIDLIVTGIRGYCPLYNMLGWSTSSSKAYD